MKTFFAVSMQIVLIALLGSTAQWPWPNFHGTPWAEVLFLTPSGIISNHLNWSIYREFYSEPARGIGNIAIWKIALMILIWYRLCVNLFFLIRRWRPA